MNPLHALAYLFGGAFVTNALPHLIAGLMGRPFQSPFAQPPGEGLSSSMVNVLWGAACLVIGYSLIAWVGAFDPRSLQHMTAVGVGALAIGLFLAHHFGRFNGGNTPGT